MMIGAFIAVLNQTLLTTALPAIMKSLHLDMNTAQWLTTIFMLINGIMIPISAYLTSKYSTRRLFNTALILFMIGSFLCFIAPNFYVMLVGRSVQALGAGILMPLMQVVLLVSFPKEQRGLAMGIFGLIIGFAPAIGPTASGWIVNHYSWHMLFLAVLIIVLIDLIIGFFVVKNLTILSDPTLDIYSVITSTIGFGGILLGFSQAGRIGFMHISVVITLIIAFISLYLFIKRQYQLDVPMLEFRIFKDRQFTQSSLLIVIMFIIFIGGMTIMPMYIQNIRGFSALQSGLILLPGGLMMGIMAPVTGKMYDRVGGKILAIIGMSLITIGSIFISFLPTDASQLQITLAFLTIMTGNGFIMTPMTTHAMNTLSLMLIPHGSAMNSTMRQICAAIGTAVLVSIMGVHGQTNALDGFHFTYHIVTILAFVGLVMAFTLPNSRTK
ncbi:MDR family MFS transporter [Macrococcus armenti]|uniref:Multidrug efflux MFS transporter n=1 Tax=Macrococcus armenti TaxID=2875764 RepID=A0ABY3ZXA2_9STAP|nr:MDR family MFS transporter [Macrococcus armenti]UOB21545.1 multidrug efflux MFS transporter [Macrococcus armenti]